MIGVDIFYRKILDDLKKWSIDKNRKPLILRGARQVGKTTVVEMFSKNFDQYIYLNLEKKEESELFDKNLNIHELMQAIFLYKNAAPSNGKILFFIDEIQNSQNAVAMIRYFYEEAKQIYIIAAGSLLETMIGTKQISFPVGRVRFLFMYPLTFHEFLIATEEKQALEFYNEIPFKELAYSKLLKLFHQYTLVGGMPEIVANWIDKRDIVSLTPLFQGLLTSYLDDVSKYARNHTMIEILRHTIESTPLEAGKRIKFQGFGSSNYKSREISEALRTLEKAMLVYLLYPSTNTLSPIINDKKKSPRLQFLDTGLINFLAGLQSDYFQIENLDSIFKGRILEHIIGQELLAIDSLRSQKISFWVREKKQSQAEIDFIIQYKDLLIPVEVKSGKEGRLKSLHLFMDKVEHKYAVRFYAGKFSKQTVRTRAGKEFILLNLPYFLVGRIFHYLEWFIEK